MDVPSLTDCFRSQFDWVRASLAILTIWMLLIWSKNQDPKKRLPPSPFQLPIVGCLPFMDTLVHQTLDKWAKRFGKIYCCRLGGKLVVVLNDAELVRDAFNKPEFNGRPFMYTASVTSQGYGISFASDETWPMHRRFAFKTFRQLGVGKGRVEERVQEETDRLTNSIAQFEGRPFGNKLLLQGAVGNIIGSVLFGLRFDAEDPKTFEFYDQMNAVFRFFGPAGILNIFPILRIVPSIRKSFEKVTDALACAAGFVTNVIKQHEECSTGSGVHDYTDAFIRVKQEEKRAFGQPKYFTDQQFVCVARELFLSGYDTTVSTLRWAFLYMLKYPEIQLKVQAELDDVVGMSRTPGWNDLKKLPYLQAVLCESARLSSIAPLAIPHRAMEDSEIGGYFIPKDSWIMANFWHIHHAQVWGDPEVFRPERFLSADGKELIAHKEFLPFSVGKRACPGESLAKMEIFLIFAKVLQQFSLTAQGDLDTCPVNGITLDTQNYMMTALPR